MTNTSELEVLLKQAYENLHSSLVKQHSAVLVSLRDEFLAARAKATADKPVRRGYDAWPTNSLRMGRFEYQMNAHKQRTFSPLLVQDPNDPPYTSHHNYVVAEDFDARVKKLAEKFATEALEGYVAKLTSKLTGIWGSKEIKEMKFSGSLDYHFLHFSFTDSSAFAVQNSVVHHINSHGTWYAQFPTTFHAVILSNGMAMKQASEAKMKKLFPEVAKLHGC